MEALQSSDLANSGSILSNGAIWIYATGSAENSGRIQGDSGLAAQLGSHNLGPIVSGGIVNLQTAAESKNGDILQLGNAAANGLAAYSAAGRIEIRGKVMSRVVYPVPVG